MKHVVSVNENIRRKYVKRGSVFTAVGILGLAVELLQLTGVIGIVISLVHLAALVALIVYMLKIEHGEKEEFDEMAETHFCRAKAKARDSGISVLSMAVIIVSAICLVLEYIGIEYSLSEYSLAQLLLNLLFIFVGSNDLVVGKEFASLEEE